MATHTSASLEVILPSDREILLRRSFDAPRSLVFEAWTQPRHLRRWWGCDASSLSVCEVDLRPGGAYRFVLRTEDGAEHPFTGVYQVVEAPARLVHTQVAQFGTEAEQSALVTVTFDEAAGKCTVTETTRFDSAAARDAFLRLGAELGSAQSLRKLAALLRTLQQRAVE